MSLSQKEFGNLRSLYESVYAPKAETILEGFTDEDLDLTDEEIEEQVEEVFLECIEEGYEIDEIERAICEAVDVELEVLNEVTSPAKVAVARMKNKAAAAGGEGSGDAGAKARAKLNVSKQKVGGSSEKKVSTLSRIKGAVKKVGKAIEGGAGLASRAVGTAQRAGSAVKSAAKKGYERGRYGSSGKPSSSSSASGGGSSSSGASSSSGSSSSGTSSASGGSSSASGGDSSSSSGSSAAPKKRKDGLLKRGLKKIVRGAAKVVSTGAGAVKAGADYVTDRARKEELEATGLFTVEEIEHLVELSTDTLNSYMDKAEKEREAKLSKAKDQKIKSRMAKHLGKDKKAEKLDKKALKNYSKAEKRDDSIDQAYAKVQKAQGTENDLNKRFPPRKGANVPAQKSNMLSRAKAKVRNALRKEDLEATGLFSGKEIEAIMEAEMSEGYKRLMLKSTVACMTDIRN